jgi:hypothetical protein
MTKQGVIRGRDLDPDHRDDLAVYLASWVKFLKNKRFPVSYVSLHNEGESWLRWPRDGTNGSYAEENGHDYNLFWDPQQVVGIMNRLRPVLDQYGLEEIGITNGETTNWYRLGAWGFADAIVANETAINNLSLITSHGFYVGSQEKGRWFGPHSNYGIHILRAEKPSLHAWATSSSWDIKSDSCHGARSRHYIMNAGFIKQIHGNIYEAGVNAFIPWAVIQRAAHWNKPDPNPGSAFRIYEDGTWEVKKAYYYYKQVCRAGQPQTAIVKTSAMDSEIALIGFAGHHSGQTNAFVMINFGPSDKPIRIYLKGNISNEFEAFRTSGSEEYTFRKKAVNKLTGENYRYIGIVGSQSGYLDYTAPANSVTTFYELGNQ